MNLNPLDISIIFKDSLLPEEEVSLGIFKLWHAFESDTKYTI